MTASADRRTLVCPCHDVTLADIEDALAESHTDVETLKWSTAVYMGPARGSRGLSSNGTVSSANAWVVQSWVLGSWSGRSWSAASVLRRKSDG